MGRPASIPSPSSGSIDLFGLSIHAYGLMIASGVLLAVWLTGRRLERAGAGTKDDVSSMAMWAVAAGVIGARLYYIVTDKSQPWKEPSRWLKVWEGGLGIPGGLLAGVLVGMWATRRRGVSVTAMFTAAAPAIPLAQAVGRLGNWWNQELFGRPTSLPWGLEIDDAHLPEGYASGTLFHPTFLYEALWNVALAGALILIDRKVKLKPGRLLAVYVAGYAAGRFWVEGLRIDPANAGGGWRLNQWTAVVAFVLAVAFLVWDWRRPAAVTSVSEDESDVPVADGDDSDTPVADGDDYVPEDD